MEDTVELGGNIELSGFSEFDGGSMVVIKKVVGTYAKKFSESSKDFEKLSVTVKPVHQREKSEKFELHAKLTIKGKPYTSEITDRNIYFALDRVLKKLEAEQGKK